MEDSRRLSTERGLQLAEDLRTLAWLHASEHPSAVWTALHDAGFPQGFAILPPDDPSMQSMADILADLRLRAAQDRRGIDDDLAADFAAIYLTHALHASPCESVWRDEDHLMWQGPTFEVRETYRRHGLAVRDWREMPDDHLCNELAFVAILLARGEADEAHAFLREHLMAWLPGFALRVTQRARTAVYAGLAALTARACLALQEEMDRLPAPVRSVGS